MEGIAAEVSHKLKLAINAKLVELGAYVDNELSNYVMVMVTNRRSKAEMDRELQLFLGTNTSAFTSWLQSVWMKLEQVTVTNSGFESSTKRKSGDKKKKNKKGSKSSSESDDDKKRKKKRKLSAVETPTKESKKRKLSKVTSAADSAKIESFSEDSASAKSFVEERMYNSTDLATTTTAEAEKRNLIVETNPKRSKGSVLSTGDEEDFLNIKDDFDSEFLSGNECSDEKASRDDEDNDEDAGQKLPRLEAASNERPLEAISNAKKDHRTRKVDDEASKEAENIDSFRSTVTTTTSSSRCEFKNIGTDSQPSKEGIGRRVKTADGGKQSKARPARVSGSRSPSPPPPPARSRSQSVSQTAVQAAVVKSQPLHPSRSPSPLAAVVNVHHSKLARRIDHSRSPFYCVSASKRESSSPPAITTIAKLARLRERSPSMVDARELINRKRAMVHANDKRFKDQQQQPPHIHRKNIGASNVEDADIEIMEKRGGSKTASRIIRIKNRDRSKENVNVEPNGNRDNDDECYDEDHKEEEVEEEDDEGGGDGRGDDSDADERKQTRYQDGRSGRRRGLHEKFVAKLEGRETSATNYSRFVVSKRDGKRLITVRSSAAEDTQSDLNSATAVSARSVDSNAHVIDVDGGPRSRSNSQLRGRKRTVYATDREDAAANADTDDEEDSQIVRIDDDEDDDATFKKQRNLKLRKSVLKRINKYMKEEPPPQPPTVVVACSEGRAGGSTKPIKLQRNTKLSTTPAAATGSLIRKAVADAHKSLTHPKDECWKKKEMSGPGSGHVPISSRDKHENKNEEMIDSVAECQNLDADCPPPKEHVQNAPLVRQYPADSVDDSSTPPQARSAADDDISDGDGGGDNIDEDDLPPDKAEEYDPSRNMPQFVVTLTGLDPKLYTQDVDDDDVVDADFMDQDTDGGKLKLRSQERCKFYPNCLAGDQCLFYHPVIPCKMFPNCKYGNNCLYVHPKCKFDVLCTRYDCNFQHSVPKMSAPVNPRHVPSSVTAATSQPCKFYYSCVNPLCPFQHPKICRFDRFCTNRNCTFSHTSLSHVSAVSKDKLKWCKPKDAESKTADSMAELRATENAAVFAASTDS